MSHGKQRYALQRTRRDSTAAARRTAASEDSSLFEAMAAPRARRYAAMHACRDAC